MDHMAGTLVRESTDTSTRAEWCDYCVARAYVRVRRGEAQLDFCGHDFERLSDALAAGGWEIVSDARGELR